MEFPDNSLEPRVGADTAATRASGNRFRAARFRQQP